MKTSLRIPGLVVMLGMSLLLAACGGGATTPANGGGEAAGGAATTIDIASDGENLAYDQESLTVSSGQEVTVNFENTSAAQQHNWVLVNGGDDVAAEVAQAGVAAGAGAAYLPADQSNIIAATDLLNGGESGSVTFTAPAPGTYLYICTVPGHYPLMQGTLTVE